MDRQSFEALSINSKQMNMPLPAQINIIQTRVI